MSPGSFPSIYSVQDPSPWGGANHIQSGFPSSVYPFWKYPLWIFPGVCLLGNVKPNQSDMQINCHKMCYHLVCDGQVTFRCPVGFSCVLSFSCGHFKKKKILTFSFTRSDSDPFPTAILPGNACLLSREFNQCVLGIATNKYWLVWFHNLLSHCFVDSLLLLLLFSYLECLLW